MRPQEAFQRALELCYFGVFGDTRTIADFLSRGREIPDRWLPGRLILRMGPEERAALTKLTSQDTWHRPDAGPGLIREDTLTRRMENVVSRR